MYCSATAESGITISLTFTSVLMPRWFKDRWNAALPMYRRLKSAITISKGFLKEIYRNIKGQYHFTKIKALNHH